MAASYSLDNAIREFFETYTTVSRQQCDEFALTRAGGQVNPVRLQGTFSYTVTAGTDMSKIFQFRIQTSSISMETMKLAKKLHLQLVPGCEYHGTMGESRPVHVYEMDNVPGVAYIFARHVSVLQPADAVFRQRRTVKDLASFFAQSWNNKQHLPQETIESLLRDFSSNFDLLARSLPPRFASSLTRVRQLLPTLFSGTLPFVLTHGDLCEMNLLINAKTGSITGIVDWAEADILPFGFSLWGLENILGYMDHEGWHYYDNRHELERLFWQTFAEDARNISGAELQLIRAARMVGMFCRYGFIVEGKDVKGVVDLSDVSSQAYLDAFCMNFH